MSQTTRQKPTNESSTFIRQSFLRGHLTPAFKPPPTKHCTTCSKRISCNPDRCVSCRNAGQHAGNYHPCTPDSYVDACGRCGTKTLHLGPGWCVECNRSQEHGVFSLFCEHCETAAEAPMAVKNGRGGLVDMMEVDRLYCVDCGRLADSYERLGNRDVRPER
ncbi:hypothetical protein ACJ41O_005445 [Fusarium nematophilum]